MKAPKVKYLAADRIEDAVEALAEYGDDAKVLAGGQSLLPMLNMRLARPEVLIDISRIEDLRQWSVYEAGCTYGAMVVHSAFEDGVAPDHAAGLLRAVAGGIGYRAVRNRGSLGGSLSHADPSAEWPLVMAALGAELECVSADGARTVSAAEFVLGFMANALADTELLTSIRVPSRGPDAVWGFMKMSRKPGEFAESIAVILARRAGAVVVDVEAWLGGAGDVPRRVNSLTEALSGREFASVLKSEVVSSVAVFLAEVGATHSEYRTHLHGITMWRAWERLGLCV